MDDVMTRSRHRCALERRGVLQFALLFSGVLLCATLAGFGAPCQAWAKSYTCPSVNIMAQAQTDGTLHVVEQRTFDFDGAYTAVWWEFKDLPSKAEVEVASVRVAPVDDAGNVVGEWQTLDPVKFQIDWREEGGPGHDAWSFDTAKKHGVRVFRP